MFIDILTVIILFLTFLSVLAYTFIAKKQTDELIKQRKLSVMPSLLFTASQFTAIADEETGVYLKNIGKGSAMNITIENFYHPECGDLYYEFQPVDLIHSGETVNVEYKHWKKHEERLDRGLMLWMFDKNHNSQFIAEIKINFMDIEGNKYQQTNRVGKGKYHHGPAKSV
ncbi:hypothetical protein [Desulfospira joergensenii]|uniref:hypothetical protein n=1 Tax=Desulfospira joergensenii TaxID=53329 RepID=UPI0003B4FA1D|nr:hypothetical protein [Desulfospira joergensenii]